MIVLGERHLRHVLGAYQQYYNGTRTQADEVCPGDRQHSFAAGSRRIAPSLRPDLICDRDTRKRSLISASINPSGEHRLERPLHPLSRTVLSIKLYDDVALTGGKRRCTSRPLPA